MNTKMQSIFRFTSILLISALLVAGCGLSSSAGGGHSDAGQVSTTAAQTMVAQLATSTAPVPTDTPIVTQAPTQALPSQPTPASTQEPTQPVTTTAQPTTAVTGQQGGYAAPSQPTVVSTDYVNCRSGPGVGYPVVSNLNPGAQSTVVGQSQASDWWYIVDPLNAGGNCWVYSGVTFVDGNTSALPVVAAPPLPYLQPVYPQQVYPQQVYPLQVYPAAYTMASTAFSAVFSNFLVCDNLNLAVFAVTNNTGDE